MRGVICAIGGLGVLLTGCAALNTSESAKQVAQTIQTDARVALETPQKIAPVARAPKTYWLGAREINDDDWLRATRVALEIGKPVPLSAVVAMLREQGINVSSELPLDGYFWSGKINATDAESGLKNILGSIGLDYKADNARKLVLIRPLTSRTWYVGVGNRKSSYSASSDVSATGGTSQQTSNSSTGGNTGASTANTGNNNSSNNNASSNSNGGNGNVASSSSTEDFWATLSAELTTRLTVLVPRPQPQSVQIAQVAVPPPLPQFPGQFPGAPQTPVATTATANNNDRFISQKVGSFSVNPDSGAVTVQAPSWMLDDIDAYMQRVIAMYNTDITLSGELVLVTSTKSNSEGIDVLGFAQFASSKFSAVVANNALGGITLSFPNGSSPGSVSVGNTDIGGALVGARYRSGGNALDIFNAYLAQAGTVSVIQKPIITTTSGVPGVFSKKTTDFYNTVTQQAAAGGTGAAVTATQNVLVPLELGTELRINPRLDMTTGLIRAQLSLNQTIRSGNKVVPQTITAGNIATTVNTTIPLLTRQNINGEVILRDGDLIIVGGQTEQNTSSDASGIPGSDGPLGGLLGTKKSSTGSQTYYFALRVVVNQRK